MGGAYAHRFEGLLSFLNIPYLVITDLDSVDPDGKHPARRGDHLGALTSNASLKKFFSVNTVHDLLELTSQQKTDRARDRCVAFQTAITVEENGNSVLMIPRTIEEAFAYDNFTFLRSGELNLGIYVPDDLGDAYQAILERIGSSAFKKTDFALDVLASGRTWVTPGYVAEGLHWLEQRLEKRA